MYWLSSTYLGLAFAAALVTTLTLLSEVRVLSVLGLVLAAFGALAAHRWRPRAARVAHWAMLGAAVVTLGTCTELVELPPQYALTLHRGVQVEYADEGVRQALPQIRELVDQVYARSGLSEPTAPLRMRFVKNTGGRPFQVGDWSDAGSGGVEIALSTDRGSTRGESFLLEGSFLLTEALARRAQPKAAQGPINGFAYWTMLGISPRPEWTSGWLRGASRERCTQLSRVALDHRPSEERIPELTIWLPGPQVALHLNAAPYIDAELAGGQAAALAFFERSSGWDMATWRTIVEQHCAR